VRFIRNTIFIVIIIILISPLAILSVIVYLPFSLIDKYQEAIAVQEEFEETGRKPLECDNCDGFRRYLKSSYKYEGIIDRIEDNKIYFLVDEEQAETSIFNIKKYYLKDVEDYIKIIDLSNYDFDYSFFLDDYKRSNLLIYKSNYVINNNTKRDFEKFLDKCLIIEETVEEIVPEGEEEGEEYLKTYIEIEESGSENYVEEQLGDLLWN